MKAGPKSFDELERAYLAAPAAPTDRGTVVTICVRKGGGIHESPHAVEVTIEGGVAGDRWKPSADPRRGRQLTLMNAHIADLVAHAETPAIDAGDNFLVDFDLSAAALPTGTRVQIGAAVVEITPESHLACRKFSTRFGPEAAKWINNSSTQGRRLRGVNARVVKSGPVRVGDAIHRLAGPGDESPPTSDR